MATPTLEQPKNDSLGKNLGKAIGKKLAKKTSKYTLKATKKAIQLTARFIRWILEALGFTLSVSISSIFIVALCTILIVTAIFNSVSNIEDYKQECPELVKAYYQEHYQEFKAKVEEFTNSPEFMGFVVASEFDNGYTKMVYGGTNAYTQEELKGNYNGVQNDDNSTWVTKNGKKYKATSTLEAIQKYIDKGVSKDKILINDEYLKGYGNASGYKKKNGKFEDTMKFEDWLNNSYYTIPFYYHWNMAKNSEYETPLACLGYVYDGTSTGLPNWNEDGGYWDFMKYASNTNKYPTKYVFGSPAPAQQIFSNIAKRNYKNMTYEDYLNCGWTKYYPKKGQNGATNTASRQSKDEQENRKNSEFAQGVMLGYKMKVQNCWLEKVVDLFSADDSNYNYYPFSKYFYATGESHFNAGINDLYVFDWYNQKNGNTTNYKKYLAEPKNIEASSKREQDNGVSIINSQIEVWKDNFVDYFTKEAYYNAPNSDYIVDYFMSDTKEIPREKKIAFLQRNFYAMATGSSLDYDMEENYRVEGGKIYNGNTGNKVGDFKIQSVAISELKNVGYKSLWKNEDTKNRTIEDEKESDYAGCLEAYKKWELSEIPTSFSFVYSATIQTTFKDGTTKDIKKVPVTLNVNDSGEISIEVNPKKFSSFGTESVDNKAFSKYVEETISKDVWTNNFYERQWSEDQYENSDGGQLKPGEVNPLDQLKVKAGNYFNIEDSGYGKISVDGSTNTYEDLKDSKVLEYLNACYSYNKKKSKGGNGEIANIFSVKLKGKRSTTLKYNDFSCMNYYINEVKDENGNIENVYVWIGTHLVDTSVYDDGEYRIAYGFENDGAYAEAFKMLNYFNENEGLDGVSEEVDTKKLVVSLKDSTVASGGMISSNSLVEACAYCCQLCEGGTYDYIANGSLNEGFTVGIGQWYNGRGWNILRRIANADSKTAKSILGNELYNKLVNKKSDSLYISNEDERLKYKELLKTKTSKTEQDAQLCEDMQSEVISFTDKKGIKNTQVIVYVSQLIHNSPANGQDVLNQLISKYGSAKAVNEAKDALDTVHKIALTHKPFNSLGTRLPKAYNYCKGLTDLTNTGDYKDMIKWLYSKVGKHYSQALRFGGKNVRWSGEMDGDYYDCSSLAYFAWSINGVNIWESGTVASEEARWCTKNGVKVEVKDLQAGDLLFYSFEQNGRFDNISHVAIAIGNGYLIEAASPSQGIVKGKVYTSGLKYCYRPVVKNKKESKK